LSIGLAANNNRILAFLQRYLRREPITIMIEIDFGIAHVEVHFGTIAHKRTRHHALPGPHIGITARQLDPHWRGSWAARD
jgi:hypothetical protein